jgi:hypothetical protein
MPNQVKEQKKNTSVRGMRISFYISQIHVKNQSHTTPVFTNLFIHILAPIASKHQAFLKDSREKIMFLTLKSIL